MSKDKGTDAAAFEPMRIWREWYQESEKQWSDAASQFLANDQVAKSTGKYAQEAMHLQRMFNESMAQFLTTLNLPARTDIQALSDRIGQLEDGITGLQVEVRQLRQNLAEQNLTKNKKVRATRPKRTKQPAKED